MHDDCSAVTRELPDHYPFVVCKEYISATVREWVNPCDTLRSAIERTLLEHVNTIVERHFGKFAQSDLQRKVTCVPLVSLTQKPLTALVRLHFECIDLDPDEAEDICEYFFMLIAKSTFFFSIY